MNNKKASLIFLLIAILLIIAPIGFVKLMQITPNDASLHIVVMLLTYSMIFNVVLFSFLPPVEEQTNKKDKMKQNKIPKETKNGKQN